MVLTLDPVTRNAQLFSLKYGTKFIVRGFTGTGKGVNLQSVRTKRHLTVERHSQGIVIDGELFCKEW